MELNKDKLLELYPSYNSVLGPYERPDGRKHIVLNNSSLSKGEKGKTKTISYPKALVESNIGRVLLPNETIDHKDRNKTNDTKNNLIIKDRSLHISEDVLRVSVSETSCVQCGETFIPTKDQRNSQKRNKDYEPAGPFCSKRCSGLYGKNIQKGCERIERKEINKTYYRLDK